MRICNLKGRSYLDPASNSHHYLTGKCVAAGGGAEQLDLGSLSANKSNETFSPICL